MSLLGPNNSSNTLNFDIIQRREVLTEQTFPTTNCFSKLLHNLDKVEPVYTDFDGWKTSTEGIEKFEDLPDNTKKYITYISDFINTPINIISIGPGRHQIIKL